MPTETQGAFGELMEDWKPCEHHHWMPFSAWRGRYYYGICRCVGYRVVAVLHQNDIHGTPGGAIVPYICPTCKGPTSRVSRKHGRPLRCLQCYTR